MERQRSLGDWRERRNGGDCREETRKEEKTKGGENFTFQKKNQFFLRKREVARATPCYNVGPPLQMIDSIIKSAC